MGFLNSSIFYYLFLLAIPVIIHLFNFRRHKKVYFSSTYFLKEIHEKNKSKYQIRRWIILANRLIAITLIIAAFGLPYIKNGKNISEATKIGIYIDNSFSMERIDNKKVELIDYAKNNAKNIIKKLNTTQQVLIITNDFEKKHQKWYAPKEAFELIDDIIISNNQQNINTIFNRYQKSVDTLDLNRFYIFSDFQQKLNQSNTILNKYSNVKIGLLHANSNDNVSIDSCYFNTPIRKKNEIENLTVSISNHSSENKRVQGKLVINNQQKGTYSIEVPSKSIINQDFYYNNPPDIDTVNGIITINDDNLDFDNKLYFSYNTNQKLKVALIYNEILNRALINIFSDSLFHFSHYNTNQIEYQKLNNCELIVLDGLNHISSGLSKNLEKFVNNGGHLLIFVNEDVEINSYNKFFHSMHTDFLSEWKQGDHTVKYINYEHSIFNDVFKEKTENINLPKVMGYFSINENKKSQRREILTLKNNDIFLSQYIVNKGEVFICYSDLNTKNTNFSEHALFIPCVYNTALTNLKKDKLFNTIDNEIIIEKNNINSKDIINLKKGVNFDMIPSITVSNQRTLINFKNHIKDDGNYHLIVNHESISPISFNYTRDESKMHFLNKNQIKNLFSVKNIDFLKLETNSISKKYTENETEKKIEYFFIISAIIILIIELILLRIWKI